MDLGYCFSTRSIQFLHTAFRQLMINTKVNNTYLSALSINMNIKPQKETKQWILPPSTRTLANEGDHIRSKDELEGSGAGQFFPLLKIDVWLEVVWCPEQFLFSPVQAETNLITETVKHLPATYRIQGEQDLASPPALSQSFGRYSTVWRPSPHRLPSP